MEKADSFSRELEFCIRDIKSRADSRVVAFNVQPEIKKGEIILKGFVHAPQQKGALLDALSKIPRIARRRIFM